MAGYTTNGLPLVGAAVQNGVTQTPPQGQYPQVTSRALIAVDTESPIGQPPKSVAATAFQVAAAAAEIFSNTATSTAGAATLNTNGGLVTTEALATAAGSTYSFVLTNSLFSAAYLAAGTIPQVTIYSKSNTTAGMQPTSVTVASGSATFVFTNNGSAALNGTMLIAFHV